MTNAQHILDQAAKTLDAEAQQAYADSNANIDKQKWNNFLDSDTAQKAIGKAYELNPVMTTKDISDIMNEGLPRYQRRANKKWLDKMTEKAPQTTAWYYEQGDSLFVRKGNGWAFVGGGFQQ